MTQLHSACDKSLNIFGIHVRKLKQQRKSTAILDRKGDLTLLVDGLMLCSWVPVFLDEVLWLETRQWLVWDQFQKKREKRIQGKDFSKCREWNNDDHS